MQCTCACILHRYTLSGTFDTPTYCSTIIILLGVHMVQSSASRQLSVMHAYQVYIAGVRGHVEQSVA